MNRNSGDVVWRSLLFNSFVVSGILSFSCDRAFSQITPDDTLGDESSVVNPRDATSESIDGGAVRGQNLFHSFEEFNVGEDRGVYFANPDAVTDIFSRVTGNDVSDILGTLGVDGAANLFLINPNGIVFGEGASLDVQGSFAATTADGIEFGEQGFFNAVNPANSVLTISVPLGLQFGSNPGSIINRSVVKDSTDDFVGLQVPDGENITLVGGDINFEGGEATASGGNIEIGGLSAAGEVSFNDDGSLSFPENISLANVSLSNAAEIDARGTGGGNININALNLDLIAGQFGRSLIRTGIRPESISTEAQAGDVNVNVQDELTLDNSRISNQVFAEGIGNSGDVDITTGSLNAINGGDIDASTLGQGNAGSVNIVARDIAFDGETPDGFGSGANSIVGVGAEGNTEGINISTNNLTLTNGGRVLASRLGQGNAGQVSINATENITATGETLNGSLSSGIFSLITTNAPENTEGINISTANLTLINGGRIDASTFFEGNAGQINITATENITFDGETSSSLPSGVFSQVESSAVGDAGGIKLSTNNLALMNGGSISATTLGRGNAGAIEINAMGDLTFDGESSRSIPSGVFSQVNPGAVGNSGGVTIFTNNLTLRNGGRVTSDTLGRGNAGGTNITAKGDISIDGQNSTGFNSGVLSQVGQGAVGNAGGVKIFTTNLTLTNGGGIDASTLGEGNAGVANITAKENIIIDGEDLDGFTSGINSQSNPVAKGDAGGVIISTNNLTLTNGGQIDASIGGQGNGGSVDITATGDVVFDGQNSEGLRSGATSIVEVGAKGDAGGVIISTNNLTLTDDGRVSASTLGQGDGGKLEINANSLNLDNNAVISSQSESTFEAGNITLNIANSLQTKDSEISTSSTESSGGNLTIAAGDIQLRGNSDITTNIFSGEGSGGNIAIKADSVIAFDDSDIFAFAVDGRGGNITLDTPAFFAENFTLNSLTAENTQLLENNNRADVNATGNQPGVVSVPDVSFIQNSLTELENNSINTDELVANSCVSPVGDRQQGKFIITGGQSLPVRPGDGIPSKYPTGEVRSVPESNHSSWRSGDPIVEPQGAYRLANGKLVLSRQCSQ